ncbi:MAG TPA: patatin-like phospholipase family protein [Solirubrobacterales bacterium]|jgi:NTE family protein
MTQSPDLETVGSANHNLVEPCKRGARRPKDPARRDRSLLALSFSGGGWRAALTAAGVLRFVAEAGLLPRVRWVSSVSGGSVTNGILATSRRQLAAERFSAEAVDEHVIAPLLGAARDRSLTKALLSQAWRLPWSSRTELLADRLAEWLGLGVPLEGLDTDCLHVFNGANETTGVRFNFDAELVGDYVIGFRPTAGTGLRVADAVSMSAAVPGAFNARSLPEIEFPCGHGRDARIADGGAYDNLGLEAIDDIAGPCLVVLSAGGLFRTGWGGLTSHIPVIKDLKRAESLLYRQSTALRSRTMVERFEAWEKTPAGAEPPGFARRGVLFGLATTPRKRTGWMEDRPEFPFGEDRLAMAGYKTTFNRIEAPMAAALIHRGWWMTGATLSAYHPDLLPADLPGWRELP